MFFLDRYEAGRLLAKKLDLFKGQKNMIVLGLARGGVVVAYEIAKHLSLPLNVLVPRKIGAPGNSELALGSIMEDGKGVFNSSIINMLRPSQDHINQEIEREKKRAQERLSLYTQFAPKLEIKDRTVILVDDGIATGSTILTCIQAMKSRGARKIIVAVPVASADAVDKIKKEDVVVISLQVPEDFISVGMYYKNFNQTEDQEVVDLLKEANHEQPN